jgi:methyl-accepting chemotaxis protein
LLNVSESVKVLDSIIAGITSIPLFGLDALKPTSDLSPGFKQIANNLSGVPEQLRDVSRDMQRATTSMSSMSGVIDNVALNLSAIGGSLDSAQTVIVQYQTVVKDMQGQLTLIRTGMPTWLMYARYGLWALLIWLGIAQLGLLTQGWELMHRQRAVKTTNE